MRLRVIRACLRAALILQALIVATKLIAFGRVDPPKTNARPVNFERVTVDYAGFPDKSSANVETA